MISAESSGLDWKKVDLHIHTPASKEKRTDKSTKPKDIIQRAKDLQIDAICISDHNSGDFINDVKKAAKGTGVTVFPGVEISAQGGKKNIHILAVFNPSKNSSHINSLLSQLKIDVEKRGQTDVLARGDVNQVINAIAEAGGIPLLAHADTESGVLNDMKGIARTEIIQNPALLGVHITKDVTTTFLDGKDPTYKRKIATFKASDAHRLEEIGTQVAFFKMGEMSISALRQCFYDPDTRISHIEIVATGYPKIFSIELSQGFLEGQQCKFHSGLNSIIGGAGVGKSLIVEFLRFALDQPSPVEAISQDMEGKLSLRLGIGGTVTVHVETEDGETYRIIRTFDKVDNPIDICNITQDTPYEGNIHRLFPILCYSQNEIVDIARNPSVQLEIIDRLIDIDVQEATIVESQRKLRGNLKEYIKSLDASEEIRQLKKEINDLKQEIKGLNTILDAPMFDEKRKWDQRMTLSSAISDKATELETSTQEYIKSHEVIGFPNVEEEYQWESLLDFHSSLSEAAKKLINAIRNGLQDYRSAIEKSDEFRDLLSQDHEKWEKTYEEFVKSAGGEKKALARKRTRQQKTLLQLEDKVKELEPTSNQFQSIANTRDNLLDELQKAVIDRYQARAVTYQKLTDLNKDRLRLTIQQGSNRAKFFKELSSLLYGTYARTPSIQSISENMTPREFVEVITSKNMTKMAEIADLSVDMAEKIINNIISDEVKTKKVLSYPIEIIPDDVPKIEYKKGDGEFYPLNELSAGQKCTTLMLIILSEGAMPVIVDQPEDSLDVATAYYDIVSRLRNTKENRQFILTTHNPNIAVTSDSDKFHVLKATEATGQIICCGAIDIAQVKQAVINQLEGGIEPLTVRRKKYNLKETL